MRTYSTKEPVTGKPNLVLTPGSPDAFGLSLDEMIGSKEDTFQQRMLKLIDENGMDDATVFPGNSSSGRKE